VCPDQISRSTPIEQGRARSTFRPAHRFRTADQPTSRSRPRKTHAHTPIGPHPILTPTSGTTAKRDRKRAHYAPIIQSRCPAPLGGKAVADMTPGPIAISPSVPAAHEDSDASARRRRTRTARLARPASGHVGRTANGEVHRQRASDGIRSAHSTPAPPRPHPAQQHPIDAIPGVSDAHCSYHQVYHPSSEGWDTGGERGESGSAAWLRFFTMLYGPSRSRVQAARCFRAPKPSVRATPR